MDKKWQLVTFERAHLLIAPDEADTKQNYDVLCEIERLVPTYLRDEKFALNGSCVREKKKSCCWVIARGTGNHSMVY